MNSTNPIQRTARRFQPMFQPEHSTTDVVARYVGSSLSNTYDDFDFESLSAPRKKATGEIKSPVKMRNLKEEAAESAGSSIDSLLVVQYPNIDEEKEEWAQFESVFFASNNRTSKKRGVTRNNYLEAATYLAEQASVVNGALGLFRYIAMNAGYVAASDNPSQLVASRWALYSGELIPRRSVEAATDMLNGCAAGGSHIIRPVPKGYMVAFTGIPGFGLSPNQVNDISIPSDSRDSRYIALTAQGGAWTSAVGKAAIEAASYLVSSLTDSTDANTLGGAIRRVVNYVPLSESSSVALVAHAFSMFARKTGIQMPKPAAKPIPDSLLEGVGKYMTAVVIKEADPVLVGRKLQGGDAVNEQNIGFSAELEALNANIAYSFAMFIPSPIAHYISQSAPGEKVSLTALTTWASAWASGILPQGRQRGVRISGRTIANLPRYVLPASKTKELTARRKEIGFYVEPGKGNDEGMFIANNGTLQYLPKLDDIGIDNAIAFEALLENALTVSFNAGAPLNTGSARPQDPVFALNSPGYAETISQLKPKLDKFAGSMQSVSWDYNVVMTTGITNPDRVTSHSLVGSSRANALFIADYMRKPFAESMALMFPQSRYRGETVQPETFGKDMATCGPMLASTPFLNTFALYDYLLEAGAVDDPQKLVDAAAKELKITALDEGENAPYEKGLYKNVLSTSLKIIMEAPDGLEGQPLTSMVIARLFADALHDAEGGPRSNLNRVVQQGNFENKTTDSVEDHPRYFNATTRTLAEFSSVFAYLGGKVFQLMLKALSTVKPAAFTRVDPDLKAKLPPFADIMSEVMPLATMFAKYAPDREKIYAEADQLLENTKANDSFTIDDVKLPGSQEGFQIFPHQLDALSKLSRFPNFAILDVSPGGGKTTSLLSDIGMMLHHGKAKRFLVLCPTRLARNWIEDMRKHTKDNWNFIPINTTVYKKWGEEGLAKLIASAPPNTIVVVGNDWLSRTRTRQIVIGRHVEKVSPSTELIRRFGFDYVGIDESHRTKKMFPTPSNIHRQIKSITTSSAVKYIRLATGTLINNVLMDVVGQAALYSAAIFRTPREFEENNKEIGSGLGGRRSLVYMNTAAKAAREHLSKYATVVTTRRREWAFMLPIPKETFVPVPLAPMDAAGNVDPADDAHRLMYEALFNSTLEDIKGNPELMKMLLGSNADPDDEEGEDDEPDEATKDKAIAGALSTLSQGDDQDDDTLQELSEALTPYLQRLEQAILDPLNDRDQFGNEFGSVFFKSLNLTGYVPSKVRKIIERIVKHYEQFPWKPNQSYQKDQLVDHNNKRYSFQGKAGYISQKPPSEDTDNWKPQAYGKVLVFCRYIRSVEAIYKYLPENLKPYARRFHGNLDTSWADLDQFKSSPVATPKDMQEGAVNGPQILIANEMAISEGHNLQMASRMIRVEMPWAPGELDQSAARIFRPDPSGKNARDYIYLDWVVSEGTLEVAKLGCLISKILTKAQFDESDNDFVAVDPQGNEFGYKDLNKANLPPIKMSLSNIENLRFFEDLVGTRDDGETIDYIKEYAKFASLQGQDFLHMRRTRSSKMLSVEPTPMPKGSAKMEFQPYVEGQKVVGHEDWGLVLLSDFLQNDKDPQAVKYEQNKEELVGKFVHTEFGNGVIVGVRTVNATGRKKTDDEKLEGDPQTKLTSLTIQLAGTGETIRLPADVVHLARTLSAAQVKLFAPKELWNKTEADRKRAKEADLEDEVESIRKGRKVREEVERERREIKVAKRIKEKAPVRTRRVVEQDFEDDDVTPQVELYPVVYNGYIAVEGRSDTEENAAVLKKFGFRPFGDYVFIKIPDWVTFDAVLNYLDARCHLSDSIYNNLVKAEDSFSTGRGRKFDIDLAPIADFKQFYQISHRKSAERAGPKNRPELKIYPMVIGQQMFFVADIATNPVTKKLMSATIPKAKTKFGLADGMFISFFSNKTQLKDKALEIKKAGIDISNWSEFVEAFKELRVGKVKQVETEERVTRKKATKPAAKPAAKKAAPAKKAASVKAPAKKVAAKPAAKAKPVTKTPAKKTASKAKPTAKTTKTRR